MRKNGLIFAFLLVLVSSGFAGQDFKYRKTFTGTATTVTLVKWDGTTACNAHTIHAINRDGAQTLYLDYSGVTAVADSADPSTHPSVHEIPPSTAWDSDYISQGVKTVSVVASGSCVAIIEA